MLPHGEFNSNYISPLLCTFNIDPLKYGSSELVHNFLDKCLPIFYHLR